MAAVTRSSELLKSLRTLGRHPQLHFPARLLALDGGGVKGIASLQILRRIMEKVQELELQDVEKLKNVESLKLTTEQEQELNQERLPLHYFDLAAGTSTGGIIGIMLFRLRMSTSEAIQRFGVLGYWLGNGLLKFKALVKKARFSDKPLMEGINHVIEGCQERLEESPYEKGKFFLIPRQKESTSVSPISKSAKQAKDELDNIDISTAARATSAAPTYLPEAIWGEAKKLRFWDGGLLNNNPIDQLWAARFELVEAKDPEPDISCIVSLGTGWSTEQPSGWIRWFRFINTLTTATLFMTNTRAKHMDFQRHIETLNFRQREHKQNETLYFRFDTPTKDESFNLDDYQKMPKLKKLIETYMDKVIAAEIEVCAKSLKRSEEQIRGHLTRV
ncbi:hypothetical protein BLS_006277 [Venturia inaequalis]|uniref:PNPLA domain-containing protein n=1 Tax=Venturia inaequalis TaxID=5025 RepID=A0A8H3UF69_VENIN|nr:hypothetical protein BLS_006277 [Venturia inaequalis]